MRLRPASYWWERSPNYNNSNNFCNVNSNGNANNNTASNANYVAAIMPFTRNAYSKEAHIRVPEVIIEET